MAQQRQEKFPWPYLFICVYNIPINILQLIFKCRICHCKWTLSRPPFVSDPAVSRYHVQWMPEYCSHNETRGPEKSVTQVSFQRHLCTPFNRGSNHRVQHTDPTLSASLCYAKHGLKNFVWSPERKSLLKKTTRMSKLQLICTKKITVFCVEYYDFVVWRGMLSLQKRIYWNSGCGKESSFTSSSRAPALGFLL